MGTKNPQAMYDWRDASVPQRITLTILVGAGVAVAWWLLLGGGLTAISTHFGWIGRAGDPMRRACLAAAFSIYYVRLLFTWFVFLKRGIRWGEAIAITVWIWCIFLVLALGGGTDLNQLGWLGVSGIALFALGSWINSYTEYKRHVWKANPENRRRLYTRGLFSMVRHPNYLGDLISFSGLCLISGRYFTAFIPAVLLAGFIFSNIPALDAHLQQRYGAAYSEYAERTRKLIPFLY